MLQLSHSRPLALGHQRAVHQHPHDPDLVVKTMRPESVAKRWEGPGNWAHRLARTRHYSGYVREVKEYVAMRVHPGASPPIVRIVGLVDTDLGLGLVCEKVRGPDGGVAPTLLQSWLDHGGEPPWAAAALEALREDLLRYNVIVGDLNAANLVFGSDSAGGPRLVMIDGFGEKNAVPLSSMSRHYNRHVIRRRYRRLLRDLATPLSEWTGARTTP
jgi:hypothetical protein